MKFSHAFSLALALLVAAGALAQTPTAILGGDDSPVVLFDGTEISQADLAAFETEQIGDIKILNGEQALAQFGKYGEHGVIVVAGRAQVATLDLSSDATPELPTAADEPVAEVRERVTFVSKDPYIVIDGQPATSAEMEALLPDRIESVNVLKGESATVKYGADAKDGAIEVTTKG